MLRHEVDGEVLLPVGDPGLVAGAAIVFPHRREIIWPAPQLHPVNPFVKVMQLEIVEDDDPRFDLTKKPGPREKLRVVA